MVPKSNGRVRICSDYRLTVNKCVEQVVCVTQEPEDIFASLHGSKVFSKIDLSNAFLQIPLEEESKKLTIITTPYCLFKYNFLPFGLSVSLGIF